MSYFLRPRNHDYHHHVNVILYRYYKIEPEEEKKKKEKEKCNLLWHSVFAVSSRREQKKKKRGSGQSQDPLSGIANKKACRWGGDG